MSIFAGIVSLDPNIRISQAEVAPLALALSRDPQDAAQVFSGPYCAIALVELDSHAGAAHCIDASGALTLIAGTPALRASAGGRAEDLAQLHQAMTRDDVAALECATGAYCGAHVDPSGAAVRIWTDRLGARPLYVYRRGAFLYFSTTLRVLESADVLEGEPDWQALAELAGCGYALGERTPYRGVELVAPGSLLEVSRRGVRTRRYWDWSAIEGDRPADAEFSRSLYRVFEGAVARRLVGQQGAATAFLSGGLDSRCVVGALHAAQVRIDTIAFGPRRAADLVYARQLAELLGARHFEYDHAPYEFNARMSAAYATWRCIHEASVADRSAIAWWGHGGNETIGLVAINDRIAAECAAGRFEAAIEEYLRRERIGLPMRLFRAAQRDALLRAPRDGVVAMLDTIRHRDPLRRLQLFLLASEARRKVHEQVENIDLTRFEMAIPFLDADFVASVLTVRTEALLRHEFYHRWLEEFPAVARSIPWQVYPGHAPCPLPASSGAAQQFDRSSYGLEERTAELRDQARQIGELLDQPNFPHALLDGRVLRAAQLASRLNIDRYSHNFRPAIVFARYAGTKSAPGAARRRLAMLIPGSTPEEFRVSYRSPIAWAGVEAG